MDINKFAVYQLKNIPENRQARFLPYIALQEKGIRVGEQDYGRVYTGRMLPGDSPESIRERLKRQLPRTFQGHSISVSDVLALNQEGTVSAYYVEKNGFTALEGFFRDTFSGAPVSCGTSGFHIDGKAGSWLAFDSITTEGREFFLMEHETYGKEAAWVVVDQDGKLVVDHVCHGFDQAVEGQIREYLNSLQPAKEREMQKHNMAGGRQNTTPQKGRTSVLAKLRQKQAGAERRSGGSA